MTAQSKNPVQTRWIIYDNWEHEFSIYYDEQEARKEYDARIKQINDDVGNDEYEGEEEVYLALVISKAEVVQTGVADDGDEGLYRLVSYDCSAKSDAVLDDVFDNLEFLPASVDKTNIVWITMRDVQELITNKKVELRQQKER